MCIFQNQFWVSELGVLYVAFKARVVELGLQVFFLVGLTSARCLFYEIPGPLLVGKRLLHAPGARPVAQMSKLQAE